jgi:hypothetical protein
MEIEIHFWKRDRTSRTIFLRVENAKHGHDVRVWLQSFQDVKLPGWAVRSASEDLHRMPLTCLPVARSYDRAVNTTICTAAKPRIQAQPIVIL